MPNHDISAHMCTGVHIWFPKVVKILASIYFQALEGGVVAGLGCLNSVKVLLWVPRSFCESKHK